MLELLVSVFVRSLRVHCSGADFSGVSNSSDGLLVSDIVQKAFVEVNEEGTEAAAATGLTFRMASLAPAVTFFCDRPFAFFIREEGTGITLFFGRFVQPDST